MKIGVLLHGSGVYDGTEIQEAVLSLLAIAEEGYTYQCISLDVDQHHVINHLNGEEIAEKRNVLIESARIARGDIKELREVDVSDIDALVMPGGFGTAKNFTTWAFNGPGSSINPNIKDFLLKLIRAKKPIVALCMSPTTLAKAFEGSEISTTLTVGSEHSKSPYEIGEISSGIEKIGSKVEMRTVEEISIDTQNRIICAPCYMMEADLMEVRLNIKQAIKEMATWLS